MKTKVCIKCHHRKSVENDFPKLTGRSQGNTCNKCRTEYKKQWNREHPEQARASRAKTLSRPETLERKRVHARQWHRKNRKLCTQRTREWREQNRERYNQNRREWNAKNSEKLLDRKLRKEYGITVEDYKQMLLQQQGVCAICHRPPVPHKRLAVDHDHKTGQVRGLLCAPCNNALGLFQESIEVVGRALTYLED